MSSAPHHTQQNAPIIGVTMRLLEQTHTGDVHDALSQDWGRFLATVGMRWLSLPNRGAETLDLARTLGLGGFILSGGGDAGCEPIRDTTETLLMQHALEHSLPVLGICRGFQAIQLHLKGQLVPLEGHVATTHALWDGCTIEAGALRQVNSYHTLGIITPAAPLIPLAFSREPVGLRSVEAAWAPGLLGIMWHPERNLLPAKRNVDSIRHFFAFPAECPLV